VAFCPFCGEKQPDPAKKPPPVVEPALQGREGPEAAAAPVAEPSPLPDEGRSPATTDGKKQLVGERVMIGSIAVAAAAVVVFAGRAFIPETDGCPRKGAAAVTAIFLDTSDAVVTNAAGAGAGGWTRQTLTERLARFVATRPAGEKILLYGAEPLAPEAVHPVFSRCKAAADDAEIAERLRAAASRLIALAPLQVAAPARSRVFETVAAISAQGFPPKPIAKRLVIVSDLLQHTPEFSYYRNRERLADVRDPGRVVGRAMAGAQFCLVYIRRARAKEIQGDRHIADVVAFWETKADMERAECPPLTKPGYWIDEPPLLK